MQLGRRGKIIYSLKHRLETIIKDAPKPQVMWDPQAPANYPISVESVLLEPEEPPALEENGLLPALILQYSDGIRKYGGGEGQRRGYATTNQVEEDMIIVVRAVMRGVSMGGEDQPVTIIAANMHESIDAALGAGFDLYFNGIENDGVGEGIGTIPGIKVIRVIRWKVPYDLWAFGYMVIDFPVMVTHVFTRGKGV